MGCSILKEGLTYRSSGEEGTQGTREVKYWCKTKIGKLEAPCGRRRSRPALHIFRSRVLMLPQPQNLSRRPEAILRDQKSVTSYPRFSMPRGTRAPPTPRPLLSVVP